MDILISIEFGGFYGYHDEYIDSLIEMYEMDDETDMEEAIEKVDYTATYDGYARAWLDRFNQETDLDLEFVAIQSPKYYNFETDKIEARVGDVDEVRLLNHVEDQEFLDWADPQLRSRDGFTSFYNGIKDLIERADDDHASYEILLGMVANYLINIAEINENIGDLEYEIMKKEYVTE